MRSLSTRFALSVIIISACMVPMAASANNGVTNSSLEMSVIAAVEFTADLADTVANMAMAAAQFSTDVAVGSLTDIFVQIGVGQDAAQVATVVLAQADTSVATSKPALYCPKAFGFLEKGKEAKSEYVTELQKFIASYYGVPEKLIVTGTFDPITRGFVEDLQEKNRLKGGDGSVGRKTIALIKTLCGVATSTEAAFLPPKPERNASSTQSGTTTLRVRSETSGEPVCVLKASEKAVLSGRPVTLTWMSKNAMYSLGPTGGKEDIQGSKTFVVSVPTTFRKTVVGTSGETVSCEVTVEIKEATSTPAAPTVQVVYTPPPASQVAATAATGASDMLASVGAAAMYPFAWFTDALSDAFVEAGVGQQQSASVVLTSEYIGSY